MILISDSFRYWLVKLNKEAEELDDEFVDNENTL